MAHHYEEPKGKFSPYQVKLGDGSLIYAPYDDDQCIRKVNTELRFDIGEEVQCWYNERWERGRVVQHDYEEPQAVFHPYQVELHNNVLIYAPKDDDDHIQIARRFEVGACVLCRCSRQTSEDQSEQWVTGHVVRYNVVDRDGKVCPYEVKLENGKLVNVLEDVDKFICITKEDAKVEKAHTAPRYDFTVLHNALWIWRQSFAMSREAEVAGGDAVIDLCEDADTEIKPGIKDPPSPIVEQESSASLSSPTGATRKPEVQARRKISEQALRDPMFQTNGMAWKWQTSVRV